MGACQCSTDSAQCRRRTAGHLGTVWVRTSRCIRLRLGRRRLVAAQPVVLAVAATMAAEPAVLAATAASDHLHKHSTSDRT